MSPYMLLHIPANFFADLDVLSYWASQKGIESLHVLSHSCREGTRAQVSPRGTRWAPGLGALTHTTHCAPGPHLPPGSRRPNAGGSAQSTQLNADEGSAAATGSPYLSRTVTAGLSAFAQYLLRNSLPLCAQPVHLTALCMPCMSTIRSAIATADVRHCRAAWLELQYRDSRGATLLGRCFGPYLWKSHLHTCQVLGTPSPGAPQPSPTVQPVFPYLPLSATCTDGVQLFASSDSMKLVHQILKRVYQLSGTSSTSSRRIIST